MSFARLILKLTITLTALSLALSANSLENSGKNLPYLEPWPGEITIVASTPVPHSVTPTRQYYEEVVECGFNAGMEGGSIDFYKQQFELIGDLKFKYFIDNSALFTDKRKDFIKAFENNPRFAGWKFKDEPRYDKLDELEKQYRALYKDDSKNLIYINLIGGINKIFTGNLTDFPSYLKLIQKRFTPAVWSYDQYPISVKNGKVKVSHDSFYYDFECFRDISKQTDRPFWAYCQSMAFKTSYVERPAATEAYLRFEAFSALAYGAQGIVYWTYGQRDSNKAETYYSALVNKDGKKTAAWYAAKKVNGEIKKFNDVFYQCDVKDVKHTGSKLYKGTKKLSGSFGPFSKVSSGTSGVLASRIEKDGKTYIVFVSHDVLAKQNLTLVVASGKKVRDITTQGNMEYEAGKTIKVSLDKGGYAIFEEILISKETP